MSVQSFIAPPPKNNHLQFPPNRNPITKPIHQRLCVHPSAHPRRGKSSSFCPGTFLLQPSLPSDRHIRSEDLNSSPSYSQASDLKSQPDRREKTKEEKTKEKKKEKKKKDMKGKTKGEERWGMDWPGRSGEWWSGSRFVSSSSFDIFLLGWFGAIRTIHPSIRQAMMILEMTQKNAEEMMMRGSSFRNQMDGCMDGEISEWKNEWMNEEDRWMNHSEKKIWIWKGRMDDRTDERMDEWWNEAWMDEMMMGWSEQLTSPFSVRCFEFRTLFSMTSKLSCCLSTRVARSCHSGREEPMKDHRNEWKNWWMDEWIEIMDEWKDGQGGWTDE